MRLLFRIFVDKNSSMNIHLRGDPITCWTPAQFTKQWSDFVNQWDIPFLEIKDHVSLRYCYVHGTYFVPLDQELTHDETERRKNEINYYQWVSLSSFILHSSSIPSFRFPIFLHFKLFYSIFLDSCGVHSPIIRVFIPSPSLFYSFLIQDMIWEEQFDMLMTFGIQSRTMMEHSRVSSTSFLSRIRFFAKFRFTI